MGNMAPNQEPATADTLRPDAVGTPAGHRDSGAPGASQDHRMRSLSLSLPWRRPKSSTFAHDDVTHLRCQMNEHAIDDSEDLHEPPHNTSRGRAHSAAHSIRGVLRRASTSLKGMVHRRPSMATEGTVQEESSSTARPTTSHSTWNRLRQATSFRHSRSLCGLDCTHDPFSDTDTQDDKSVYLPIPMQKDEPPVVPFNAGAAAKASAAMQNEFFAIQSVQNRWLNTSSSEDGNDRESGIGIVVTEPFSGSETGDTESIPPQDTTISRIDFVTKLPAELAIHVLAYLDAAALASANGVCRDWKKVVSNQHIWRESCLRETGSTYATSGPVRPGTGLGIPRVLPSNDWKQVYRVKQELEQRWKEGKARPVYLNGHTDSIYCLQFDE